MPQQQHYKSVSINNSLVSSTSEGDNWIKDHKKRLEISYTRTHTCKETRTSWCKKLESKLKHVWHCPSMLQLLLVRSCTQFKFCLANEVCN